MEDMNPEDVKQLNRRFDELLTRLDSQDRLSLERGETQYKMAQHFKEQYESIGIEITSIKNRLDPVYEIFDSVKGFNNIAVWVLKGLVLLGAGLAVIYGFIKYLRS